jgi:GT2 family glycosyltransferase
VSPRLGVALVHYRTPGLVRPAVEALVADCARAGVAATILLVDNGSEPADRELWRDLPVERIDPGANLGYAGGVQRAVAALDAPLWIAMNPDVVVRPGCLAALLAELERGADAAGPRFEWDEAGRLLLPPTEERTRRAELAAALARRSPARAAAARRRWRRHARRHWEAAAPIESRALSGALLAFRQEGWRATGGFDAGFQLYFEETDWLERLHAAGRRSVFVPGARAWHLYAQSSVAEPAAAAWFAAAAARFRTRHYGRAFAALLARLERGGAPGSPDGAATGPALELPPGGPAPLWVEISATPWGFPAAAERLAAPAGTWQLPADAWRRLAPGDYWLRIVDARGGESAPRALRRGRTP